MADIFISYAREDRDAIRELATRLEHLGWTVWWDRHILAGKEYDEVIQREIDRARCVLVAWSQHSVSSRWVKAEADEGAKRRVLVPIVLDESVPPLGFRNIQTVSFAGVATGIDSAAFTDLVHAVSDLVRPPVRPKPAPRPSTPIEPVDPANPDRRPLADRDPISTVDGSSDRPGPRVWISAAILVTIAATGYMLRPRSPVVPAPPHETSPTPSLSAPSAPAQPLAAAASTTKPAEKTQAPAVQPVTPPETAPTPGRDAAATGDVQDFVRGFLAAANSHDVNRMLTFYADRVDYYAMGTVGPDAISKDKALYYRRWPEATIDLDGPLTVRDGPQPGTREVIFSCHYDVSSPARKAHASGVIGSVLLVADVNGALKIVGQKETVQPGRK